MKTFVTFMCVALVMSAAAKPGYNYQPPRLQFQQQQQFVAPAPQHVASVQQQYVPSAPQYAAHVQQQYVPPAPQYAAPVQHQYAAPVQHQYAAPVQHQYAAPIQQQYAAPIQQQYAAPVQHQQQQQFVAPQYVAPVQQKYAVPIQQQYAVPVQQQQQFVAPVQQYAAPAQLAQYQPKQQQTIISKEIYVHAAPEETEEIRADQGVEAGPARKNYRIVFIKAPSQNLNFNLESLKRAQATNEEKTVIYVLSKKPDYGNLQSQLSAVQTEQKAHKPEVYFIKYKTQDEAQRAQQEIQAQYDTLGGSTHISDEGIAPVTSVIGGGRFNVGSAGHAHKQQQQFVQQSSLGSTSSSSVSFSKKK